MSEPLRLPEVQFKFRRWYFYLVTLAACAGVGVILVKLQDPEALKVLGLSLVGLSAFLALLYMVGPTVTDLARLAAAIKGSAQPPETVQ